jgi:hypothetical protein
MDAALMAAAGSDLGEIGGVSRGGAERGRRGEHDVFQAMAERVVVMVGSIGGREGVYI